jgi:hypothetical protein
VLFRSLQFGDGISSDSGGVGNGFLIFNKVGTNSINWNDINTDNMSSTLLCSKSLSIESKLLLDKLNLISSTETNIMDGGGNNSIDIIVARYNEDLEWMNEYPFNQFKYIVYNKGNNNNFNKKYVKKIINIKNVGRCDHTYLYHIITNYDNLAKINIFLPGSLDMEKKNYRSKYLINLIRRNKKAYFVGYYTKNLKEKFNEFYLDEWQASNTKNNKMNPESILLKSTIRPYGKWFTHRFGDIIVHYYFNLGIFSIDKRDIIQHPKSYYEDLINDLNTHSNPEVGHYYERSWAAVFYPFKYTQFKLYKK